MIKVEYIEHMGNDLTIVNAARVSYGKEITSLSKGDEKLVNYLAKHKHYSPFEHCTLSVRIKCPLYIRSQIHRHRTFSYNEISRRYTDENITFYKPTIYYNQHKSSKQCAAEPLEDLLNLNADVVMQQSLEFAINSYDRLLGLGVAREQARAVLPQAMMTEFYMTGNLRNWMQFLALRLDGHAQREVREVAVEIMNMIEKSYPIAGKALRENI